MGFVTVKLGIFAATAIALAVIAYFLLNNSSGVKTAGPSSSVTAITSPIISQSTMTASAATISTTTQTQGYNSSSNSGNNYANAYAACARAGISSSNCPSYCQNNPSACGLSEAQYANQSYNGNSTVAYAGDSTQTNAGSLPNCSSSTYLTRSIINASQLSNIEPLGHVNGPHILPNQADHVYFFSVTAPDRTALLTPVYAPANVTILQVAATKSSDPHEPATSYVVFFSNCRSMMYGFQLPRISGVIQNYIANRKPYTCSNSSLQSICVYANLSIGLKAGDTIGFTGIHNPNSTGIKDDNSVDFAATDVRTKPWAFIDKYASTGFLEDSYLHAVCPLDYFVNLTKAYLYSKLSARNTSLKIFPACGATLQDLPGTLQGNWYKQGSVSQFRYSGINLSDSLSVIHINVDPAFGAVSAGSALLPTDNYGAQMPFKPQSSGQINREPSQVTPDGKVYCYQGGVGTGVIYLNATVRMDNGPLGHVDMKLDNSTTLEADYSSGPCASSPALVNPVIYVR